MFVLLAVVAVAAVVVAPRRLGDVVDAASTRLLAAKSVVSGWLPHAHGHSDAVGPRATAPGAASASAPPPAGASSGANATTPPLTPAPSGATPGQPGSDAKPVPTSIAADCSVDVTTALNRWMASVADGSTVGFRSGACYRVDGTLLLQDRHDLVVDGAGARFAASVIPAASPKITRQLWYVVGGSGITLRNMDLRGTNPTPTYHVEREWFPLIQIAGTQGAYVDHVRGSHSWGDFVSVGPDVRKVTSSDGTGAVLPSGVTVRNSSASVIGRHGVTCNGCDHLVIDQNVFSDVAYQILDIEVEATAWHARDVAFTNNTIAGTVKLSVLANAGIGWDVTGVTVSGNTMTGTPVSCAPPVQVDDTTAVKRNFVISGNRFKTLGNAFWLRGVSSVAVEDNLVSVGNGGCTNSGVAVVAANGGQDVVQRNAFPGATTLIRGGAAILGSACGNKLSGTSFDQPAACPAT